MQCQVSNDTHHHHHDSSASSGIDTTEKTYGEKVSEFVKSFPINGPAVFNENFHASRRDLFLSALPPNSAVVVVGNKEFSRNEDVQFPFRQVSDFTYLTGFNEPDSIAILANTKVTSDWNERFTLVVRPRDRAKEVWTGYRAGVKGAVETFKADKAHTNKDLVETLIKVCEAVDNVFVIPNPLNADTNKKVLTTLEAFADDFSVEKNDKTIDLHGIRMIKTPYETALLQQAVLNSGEGHINAMKRCKLTVKMMAENIAFKNGRNECEIQAALEEEFKKRGGARLGYPSIVASGKNATILHYEDNNAYAKPGDLVLIDAGVEYGGYTADITRTWPLNGKFSPAQRAVYDLVLKTQNVVIEAARSGVSLMSLQKLSVTVLVKGMVELGILKRDVETLIEEKAYSKFYMHSIGHFLGQDVHDVARAKTWTESKELPLEPGMVITVEPGIYIPFDDDTVSEEYRGIGVRIEDNILITDGDAYNLSFMIPREVDKIEELMADDN